MIRYRNDCKLKPSERSKLIKAKVDQCVELNRALREIGCSLEPDGYSFRVAGPTDRGPDWVGEMVDRCNRQIAEAAMIQTDVLAGVQRQQDTIDADPLWPLEVHP